MFHAPEYKKRWPRMERSDPTGVKDAGKLSCGGPARLFYGFIADFLQVEIGMIFRPARSAERKRSFPEGHGCWRAWL